MKTRFITPAQRELDQAVEYHNAEKPGLGDDLFEEAVVAAGKLCDFPELWAKVRENIRRRHNDAFPIR